MRRPPACPRCAKGPWGLPFTIAWALWAWVALLTFLLPALALLRLARGLH